jgi:hypothetical protein
MVRMRTELSRDHEPATTSARWRAKLVVASLLVAALLTVGCGTQAVPTDVDAFELTVAASDGGNAGGRLDGATLQGVVLISLEATRPVEGVDFLVNGQASLVVPRLTTSGGGSCITVILDTARIGHGRHELVAVAEDAEGREHVVRATFQVARIAD